MSTTSFDAIVIGTGQAGPSLAGRLTAAGMKVAVIERGKFGGTCVNTGCIPTKTMVASAHAAYVARRAAEFGVDIGGPVTVDMKRVKARKDQISGEIEHRRRVLAERHEELHGLPGHGRFESPHEVSRRIAEPSPPSASSSMSAAAPSSPTSPASTRSNTSPTAR